MKHNFAFIIVILTMLALNGCNKSESPTAPLELNKGEYSGTFSVTFKNYKNASTTMTQTGSISITFYDSTYIYFANVSTSTDSTLKGTLYDRGTFSKLQNKIMMNDISWLYMDPSWHNSLYLNDTFAIQSSTGQLLLFQDNLFATWNINMLPK